MADFKYPDLIPRKFRYRLCDVPHYLGGELELRIDHGFPPKQKGVCIPLKYSDIELSRKQTLERFIKPALALLEAHISDEFPVSYGSHGWMGN